MFFRFGAALVLIVAISLAGIAIEKQNVSLKRSLTLQQYRQAELSNRRADLRLRVGRLGAPSQLLQQVEAATDGHPTTATSRGTSSRTTPLLRWQSDVRPRPQQAD
ncbi:MAG: hypothetical protein R3C01_09055 [Planctomycetaceae bacterium]